MDYLTVTSALIAVTLGMATILFTVCIFRLKDTRDGDLAQAGAAVSLIGTTVYILNLIGVFPTPISPNIARPFIFLISLFILVIAITFYWPTRK